MQLITHITDIMIIISQTKTITTPETVEGESLSTHVILCRQKELAHIKRMEDLDARQDKLEATERELRSFLLRTITSVALAILTSAVSIGVHIANLLK